MKKLYWHGTTSEKKAGKILRDGFRPYTYFASHLEDALEFGGKYVFAVALDFKGKVGWQVKCGNLIQPRNILWLEHYSRDRKIVNKGLHDAFFKVDKQRITYDLQTTRRRSDCGV